MDPAPKTPFADALESPLLAARGFRHAFFTRRGGVSRPPFDTLNFSTAHGDREEAVRENRALAAARLGVPPSRLYFLSQVHGKLARRLEGNEDPSSVVRERGDATLSTRPGVACGVRSADCVPVLVGDARTGAALAVHAGWRGTVDNVVGAGISALREAIGAPGDLVAAIGPHIEACCFEVGEDVAEALSAASPLGASARIDSAARPRVRLRAVVRAQLEAEGLPASAIDDVPGCTVCDPTRFFSYRRDGARGGRHLSAIVARSPA